MKSVVSLSLLLSLFAVTSISAQDSDRDLKRLAELRSQIAAVESGLISPSASDIAHAAEQGSAAVRLMPREKYSDLLLIRGGASYYSFVRLTHEYGYGSDISFDMGHLSVGFAGADFGFISELGEMPIASVSAETERVRFLFDYVPPTDYRTIRSEQIRARNYETESATFRNRVKAVVGNSYALRSIDFGESDVLVVFKLHRIDTDGSIIIFWKMLKTFPKPEIDRLSIPQ